MAGGPGQASRPRGHNVNSRERNSIRTFMLVDTGNIGGTVTGGSYEILCPTMSDIPKRKIKAEVEGLDTKRRAPIACHGGSGR